MDEEKPDLPRGVIPVVVLSRMLYSGLLSLLITYLIGTTLLGWKVQLFTSIIAVGYIQWFALFAIVSFITILVLFPLWSFLSWMTAYILFPSFREQANLWMEEE